MTQLSFYNVLQQLMGNLDNDSARNIEPSLTYFESLMITNLFTNQDQEITNKIANLKFNNSNNEANTERFKENEQLTKALSQDQDAIIKNYLDDYQKSYQIFTMRLKEYNICKKISFKELNKLANENKQVSKPVPNDTIMKEYFVSDKRLDTISKYTSYEEDGLIKPNPLSFFKQNNNEVKECTKLLYYISKINNLLKEIYALLEIVDCNRYPNVYQTLIHMQYSLILIRQKDELELKKYHFKQMVNKVHKIELILMKDEIKLTKKK